MDNASTTSAIPTASTARRVTLSPDHSPSRRGRTEEGDEALAAVRSPKRLRFMFASNDPALRKLLNDLQDDNADIALAAMDPLVKLLQKWGDTKKLLDFYTTGGHRDILHAMARHKNSEEFQLKALRGLCQLAGSEPKGFSLLKAGALEGAFNAARNFPTNQHLASCTISLVECTCVATKENDTVLRYANVKRFIELDVILDCIDLAKKFPFDLDVGKGLLDLFKKVYFARKVDIRPIMEVSLAWISKTMKRFPNDADFQKRACEVVSLAAKYQPLVRRRMFETSGLVVDLAHICERGGTNPAEKQLYDKATDTLQTILESK